MLMKNGVPYASGSEIPEGGTKGQVLAKASNISGDFEWVNAGGGGDTTFDVDTAMSDTSENAVQNKVIKEYVDNIQGLPSGGENGQILVRNSMSPDNAEWVDNPADNTFIFDVDSDQFTEDSDNPDGKHYGMTITSPTYDELLSMLVANKFVYVRLLYNSGNAYEIMPLFHNGNSIYGRYFDVEFPQKRLMFASAYVNKRNNDTTYFGTSQDYISGGTVDQTYNATSTNAQSGTAVAEALATVEGSTNFDVTPIPQGPTGANEINAIVSNKDTENVRMSYVRQQDGTLPNTVNLGVKSGIGEDSFVLPTKAYVDSQTGDLTALETTAQDSLVNAVNELKNGLDGLGEPFRVKQWGSNTLNVEIPYCTEDITNANIPKMVFSISDEEGVDYQIVGMLAYEVFDAASGGNRINCWPVCQFTGNGQKELSVRWMGGGTTRKTAKRINAWVLLKHR